MIRFRSIRARMTVTFALSIAVLMLLVCSGLIWYTRHTAERSADTTLAAAAARVRSELAENAEDHGPNMHWGEELEEFRAENLAMALVSTDGHITGNSRNDQTAGEIVRGDGWRTTHLQTGDGTIVLGIPWKRTEAQIRHQSEEMLLFGAFVVVLAAAGAWVLVGRTLSPIASLSHQADSASVESLNIRLTKPSEDAEIAGLVATLNGLLERLSETATAKGRFYSAASHELRTPLQALSGHLELALTRDRTQEEYKAVVKEAHKQTRRLISLVRNLLLLYQLDSASSPMPAEAGDLASVCTHALAQFQPVIQERRLQVTRNLPEDAPFVAPSAHADILVRNLVENAVRYADEGSEISVSLAEEGGMLRLSIANQCSHIPSWNADRLFEPFARIDASRNNSTGGTGLGLAICKAIATANQWSIGLRKDGSRVHATAVIQSCH